jgi:hypothetical protein
VDLSWRPGTSVAQSKCGAGEATVSSPAERASTLCSLGLDPRYFHPLISRMTPSPKKSAFRRHRRIRCGPHARTADVHGTGPPAGERRSGSRLIERRPPL